MLQWCGIFSFNYIVYNFLCFYFVLTNKFFFLFVYYSGESMENALRACCKGIKIGKILIHRDGDNGKQVSNVIGIFMLLGITYN